MKLLKFPLLALLIAGIFSLAFLGCKKQAVDPSVTSDAKGGFSTSSTQYGQPLIAVTDVTKTSIQITFTAGDKGAASGFSLQWMTKADFDQYGWPVGDPSDLLTSAATSFCKAGFSGNAFASNYNLTTLGQTVSVLIGAPLTDNGASTSCPGELAECTEYVFRAFSHGDNVYNRSIWSETLLNGKTECDVVCTKHGHGWWKNNCSAITNDVTVDGHTYSPSDICTILNTNPSVVCNGTGKNKVCSANGVIILAHQVLTAALNGENVSGWTFGGVNFLTDYQTADFKKDFAKDWQKKNESCDH